MYQGTQRLEFDTEPYGGGFPMRRKPVWKSSCPISNGERPPALAFSGGNADCAFHKNAQTPGNIACPCWHGNFDIMPIFGICQGEAQYEKFAWVAQKADTAGWECYGGAHANKIKYEKCLTTMLGNDWMLPMPSWLKSASESHGSRFFRRLAPVCRWTLT